MAQICSGRESGRTVGRAQGRKGGRKVSGKEGGIGKGKKGRGGLAKGVGGELN